MSKTIQFVNDSIAPVKITSARVDYKFAHNETSVIVNKLFKTPYEAYAGYYGLYDEYARLAEANRNMGNTNVTISTTARDHHSRTPHNTLLLSNDLKAHIGEIKLEQDKPGKFFHIQVTDTIWEKRWLDIPWEKNKDNTSILYRFDPQLNLLFSPWFIWTTYTGANGSLSKTNNVSSRYLLHAIDFLTKYKKPNANILIWQGRNITGVGYRFVTHTDTPGSVFYELDASGNGTHTVDFVSDADITGTVPAWRFELYDVIIFTDSLGNTSDYKDFMTDETYTNFVSWCTGDDNNRGVWFMADHDGAGGYQDNINSLMSKLYSNNILPSNVQFRGSYSDIIRADTTQFIEEFGDVLRDENDTDYKDYIGTNASGQMVSMGGITGWRYTDADLWDGNSEATNYWSNNTLYAKEKLNNFPRSVDGRYFRVRPIMGTEWNDSYNVNDGGAGGLSMQMELYEQQSPITDVKFSDYEPLKYHANWKTGLPTGQHYNGLNFVLFQNNNWIDAASSEKHGYYLQVGGNDSDSIVYQPGAYTWEEARLDSLSKGGQLAVVLWTSQHEAIATNGGSGWLGGVRVQYRDGSRNDGDIDYGAINGRQYFRWVGSQVQENVVETSSMPARSQFPLIPSGINNGNRWKSNPEQSDQTANARASQDRYWMNVEGDSGSTGTVDLVANEIGSSTANYAWNTLHLAGASWKNNFDDGKTKTVIVEPGESYEITGLNYPGTNVSGGHIVDITADQYDNNNGVDKKAQFGDSGASNIDGWIEIRDIHSNYTSVTSHTSDSQWTASSSWMDLNTHGPNMARYKYLHGNSIWHPKHAYYNSEKWRNLVNWLQVDLGKVMKVDAIGTKGRFSTPYWQQWVSKYILEYSENGEDWYVITPTEIRPVDLESDRTPLIMIKDMPENAKIRVSLTDYSSIRSRPGAPIIQSDQPIEVEVNTPVQPGQIIVESDSPVYMLGDHYNENVTVNAPVVNDSYRLGVYSFENRSIYSIQTTKNGSDFDVSNNVTVDDTIDLEIDTSTNIPDVRYDSTIKTPSLVVDFECPAGSDNISTLRRPVSISTVKHMAAPVDHVYLALSFDYNGNSTDRTVKMTRVLDNNLFPETGGYFYRGNSDIVADGAIKSCQYSLEPSGIGRWELKGRYKVQLYNKMINVTRVLMEYHPDRGEYTSNDNSSFISDCSYYSPGANNSNEGNWVNQHVDGVVDFTAIFTYQSLAVVHTGNGLHSVDAISDLNVVHRTDLDSTGKKLQLEWNCNVSKDGLVYLIEYLSTTGELLKYYIPHLDNTANEVMVQLNVHDSFETSTLDYVRNDDEYITGYFTTNNEITVTPVPINITAGTHTRHIYKQAKVTNTFPNCDFIYDKAAGSMECELPARSPSSLKPERRVKLADPNEHIRDNWNTKYKFIEPSGSNITVDVDERDAAASVSTRVYNVTKPVSYDTGASKQSFKSIPKTNNAGTVNLSYKFADITRFARFAKDFERVTWMNNNKVISDSTYSEDIEVTAKYADSEDYDYLSAYNFHYGVDDKPDAEKIEQMEQKHLIRNLARAFTEVDFLDYDEESVFYPKNYFRTLSMLNSPYVTQGNQNGQPFPPDNGNKVWFMRYDNLEYTFSSTLKNPVFAIWSLGTPSHTGHVKFRVLTRTVSPSGRIDYKKVNLVSIDNGANQRLSIGNSSTTHGVQGSEAYGQFMCKGEYDNIIFDCDKAEYYWNIMIGTYVREK